MSGKRGLPPLLQSSQNAMKEGGIDVVNARSRKRVARMGADVEKSLVAGDIFLAPMFDGADYQGTIAFEVGRVLTSNHEGQHVLVEVHGGSCVELERLVDTHLSEDYGIIHLCSLSRCLVRAQEYEGESVNIHVAVVEVTTSEDVQLACREQFNGFSLDYWLERLKIDPPSTGVVSDELPLASSGAASSRSVDGAGTHQASSGEAVTHAKPSSLAAPQLIAPGKRLASAITAERAKRRSRGKDAGASLPDAKQRLPRGRLSVTAIVPLGPQSNVFQKICFPNANKLDKQIVSKLEG